MGNGLGASNVMLAILAKRIALGLFTLWLTSIIIFSMTELLPGDVASVVLGQQATP